MLNLENFDKTIMRTRESKLDFTLTQEDYERLLEHCDRAMEKPVPTAEGPDYEFAYFGVLCQIYITK